MGGGPRWVGLVRGTGLTLRQADGCAGGARAIVGWVGVFVKLKGNHLIVEKGTTSDLGPAP